MASQLVELIYIAPANPLWSSVAECSRHLYGALSSHDGYFPHLAFDLRPSEVVGPAGPPVQAISQRMKALYRERGDARNLVLHAEMAGMSIRELWGMVEAQRLWPDAPCTVLLHDPPYLPEFPEAPDVRSRGGMLGGVVAGLSDWLARHGQKKVMEGFLSRISSFVCFSRRGAELVADRYPGLRDRVALIPPWAMGAAPASLEPNVREVTEKAQVNVLVAEATIGGVADVIDALAITNRQLSLSGRVSVRVRGAVHGVADQKAIEKRLKARIKQLKIEWLVDLRLGLMNDRMLNEFMTETDILVLPFQEDSGFRTCVPFMRSQAWAVTVVAADTGFMRECIHDEEDGLLYDAGQPVSLARKLLELLTDPDRRATLARALRDRASGERSGAAVADALHSLHVELLQARDEGRDVVLPRTVRAFEPIVTGEVGGENRAS